MTAPLIDYLDRRIALVDSISASLIARRQTRPQSRQSYQERALREMRARIGRDVLVNAGRASK
jgi:hypothetical protein